MSYENIREEELKNKLAQDYFNVFDCSRIIGNIDFCVVLQTHNKEQVALFEPESLLWAEAKTGKSEIFKSIVQLIITIGKARTFDRSLPPAYLGAFDAEKIAFISYNDIHDIFYQNDFNWNVTPSNHDTKEFKQVYEKVKTIIENNSLLFVFGNDDKELKEFIKINFILGKSSFSKIKIDKNNFIIIYNKWFASVKPTIIIYWDKAKMKGIMEGDFYLADLLSQENVTLKENLSVVLKKDNYELEKTIDEMGMFQSSRTFFNDNQKAHTLFWNKYERPPKEEFWDYIVERRDLLVPQDVRERKGSFFTPQIWVELSQKYITDVLGVNWQDEYTIWDCAAGTGNLLAGLTNKYSIWASTLDRQDVDVMKDRIKNGANLLEDHVFQFDFLNDNFNKLPKGLQDIINNPEKRRKLVIYINPPYAEASNKKTLERGKEGNRAVEQNMINKKYAQLLGQANAELFAQFFTRIYFEVNGCILADFSKLKILSGQHFIDFRNFFLTKLEKCFVVPANTFDNVKGIFPIGFMIWDTFKKEKFGHVVANVYNKNGDFFGIKSYIAYNNSQYMNDWIKPFRAKKNDFDIIGKFPFKGNDFQNQNMIQIVHHKMDYNIEAGQFLINQNNLIKASIYFAVRKCIPATWLNDRDQFLYPNNGWETDTEFQNDCLAYTLFSNNIQSKYGTNNWLPFTEYEVASHEKFDSNFMTDFIKGKIEQNIVAELFDSSQAKTARIAPLEFSAEAKAVFVAGKALWQYFHRQPNCNVNASLYDIREHFQGRNEKGKMNSTSEDETYMKNIKALRERLQVLAKKIEPKVYGYGFLKA